MTGSKTAIVEIDGEYRALYCVEAPDVLFEDLLEVEADGGEESCQVDPTFLKVCEPETVVVAAVLVESDVPLYAKVSGGDVAFSRPLSRGDVVRVTLNGVRAKCQGLRFARRTPEEVALNARKYDLSVPVEGPTA